MTESDWATLKYFKPHEFDSPDKPGSGLNMDYKFMLILDQIRGACGFPFPITSGYRTLDHNDTLKDSVDGSAHTKGLAADIGGIMNGRQRYLVMSEAEKRGITRIGIGDRFIHLDLDPAKPQEVYWVY